MLSPLDVHVNGPVTSLLVGYRPEGGIWDQVAPPIDVAKQSDLYFKVDKGAFFRRPNTHRAPGAGANEVNFTVSSDTYNCSNRELAAPIPDETVRNSDDPLQPMVLNGMLLMDNLHLDAEVRLYNAMVAGVGSSMALTGGNAWDQFNTSDPISNLETAREAIRSTTGKRPNTLIVPEKTWLKMRRHPDLVRFTFPGAGVGGNITPDQFGNAIFPNGGRVLIPSIIQTASPEGTLETGLTFTDVWSTHVFACYVPPNPGIMVPTFIAAFRWTGSQIPNFAVQEFRPLGRKSTTIQVGYYQDEKVIAPELGFLIQTGIN